MGMSGLAEPSANAEVTALLYRCYRGFYLIAFGTQNRSIRLTRALYLSLATYHMCGSHMCKAKRQAQRTL
jgi:hypothetical protein